MSSKNAITVCMWYKSEYYLRISVRRADIWQISCVLKTRWHNDFVLPSRIFLDMRGSWQFFQESLYFAEIVRINKI